MNNRTQEMHILWTPEEYALLTQRMAEAGVINRSAFVRKMALDGYILKLDMADIHEMIRLLRNATNNLNQMAKQSNSTGNIYGAEISDMQQKQEEIWETSKEILARLAAVQ